MKTNNLSKIILLSAFVLGLSGLKAQVTIGSTKEAAPGALLQLKEKEPTDSDLSTANKGLLLPRVELTNLYALLPMFELDDNYQEGDPNDPYTKSVNEAHTGLMVYATNQCGTIYVWDGSMWNPLTNSFKPDITMTDGDGNVYTARWFSKDPCNNAEYGAYWTINNIYSTTNANGQAFEGNVRLNPAINTNGTAIEIAPGGLSASGTVQYGVSPDPISTLNVTESYLDYAKKFGLLYNFAQAQEVCPEGWYMPTSVDWDALARIIPNDASNALYFLIGEDNYYAWEEGTAGLQWISSDDDHFATIGPKIGFNVLPAGGSDFDGGAGGFAKFSLLWCHEAVAAYFERGQPGITFDWDYANDYLSVRCIHGIGEEGPEYNW